MAHSLSEFIGKGLLYARFQCAPFGKEFVVCTLSNNMIRHFWMSSESFDVCNNIWAFFHFKSLESFAPWTILQHYDSLNHWVTMEINHHWLIITAEILASIQILYKEFFKGWHIIQHSLNLFWIFKSRQKRSPKFTEESIKFLHLKSHVSCGH